MQILQKSFITPQPVVAEAKAESQGSWNWLAFIVAIIAIIGMVIGAIVTGGALAPTAGLGITAIIKGTCIGTLIFLGSTTAAVVSVAEFVGDLGGKFDIPMISYTPFTIFSGQVPAFDVNFIEPMDDIIIQGNNNDDYEGQDFINLPMEYEDYDTSIRDSKLWNLFLKEYCGAGRTP